MKKIKIDNLSQRYLSKLTKRLMNTYNLEENVCPNANNQQYVKNLRFLMRQRYSERCIELEAWRELIDVCISQANLTQMFIELLADYDDARELAFWIDKLKIDPKTQSYYVIENKSSILNN